jgi:hypothetical protein
MLPENRKSTIPFKTCELYTSPGWTRADKKHTFLSNLWHLTLENSFSSFEPTGKEGNSP